MGPTPEFLFGIFDEFENQLLKIPFKWANNKL